MATPIKFQATVRGKKKTFTYASVREAAEAWNLNYMTAVMRIAEKQFDGNLRLIFTTPQRAWKRKPVVKAKRVKKAA